MIFALTVLFFLAAPFLGSEAVNGPNCKEAVKFKGLDEMFGENICRVQIGNDIIPGQVTPYKASCSVVVSDERAVDQVLSNKNSQILMNRVQAHWYWARSRGVIPRNAIRGGYQNNEKLYIGRVVKRNGVIHIGKVRQTVPDVMEFAWNGEVYETNMHEFLVCS